MQVCRGERSNPQPLVSIKTVGTSRGEGSNPQTLASIKTVGTRSTYFKARLQRRLELPVLDGDLHAPLSDPGVPLPIPDGPLCRLMLLGVFFRILVINGRCLPHGVIFAVGVVEAVVRDPRPRHQPPFLHADTCLCSSRANALSRSFVRPLVCYSCLVVISLRANALTCSLVCSIASECVLRVISSFNMFNSSQYVHVSDMSFT